MRAPPEFDRLARSFYPYSDEDYPDRSHLIASSIYVMKFSDAQVEVLRTYLDCLLAESNEGDLEKAWTAAGAYYTYVGPNAMREFLTQVRRMLDEPPDVLDRLVKEGLKRLVGE